MQRLPLIENAGKDVKDEQYPVSPWIRLSSILGPGKLTNRKELFTFSNSEWGVWGGGRGRVREKSHDFTVLKVL